MIIYCKSKAEYIDDVDANNLSHMLNAAFVEKTGWLPVDSRVWGDEYRAFSRVLHRAEVDDDVPVAIEYHLSAVGRFRVDVLLAGSNGHRDHGVIIELKAWTSATVSDYPEMVITPLGGRPRVTQHPCVQAGKYRNLITDYNHSINEANVDIDASAYLYNLHRRDPEPLEDPRYESCLTKAKLYFGNDVHQLKAHLEQTVPHKPKQDVFWLLENGRMRPSKSLIDRVGSMLEGNAEFELLDEQNEAFQIIRHTILDSGLTGRHAFVVRGGPGTGKSIIAVRLLADVLRNHKMGCIVAPNAAFRKTIVEHLSKKSQHRDAAESLFRSSWNFHATDYQKDPYNDIILVDEAHRLRDRAYQYKGTNMVDDMVRSARISVFFLDEGQRVYWNDIGSIEQVSAAARRHGVTLHEPLDLVAQFRCNGSDGYLNWLDDALQIRPTANFLGWGASDYEFRVFEKAQDLLGALTQKNGDNSARVVAGYTWAWPNTHRQRGASAKHVVADGLSMPWNFDGENWATAKDGITQVGCIHTCQGLEFDWIGILIGDDLSYRDGKIIGHPDKRAKTDASLKGWKSAAKSPDAAVAEEALARVQSIIKNTYKVLMTRGRRGCYVWCSDAGLREYLLARLRLMRPEASS